MSLATTLVRWTVFAFSLLVLYAGVMPLFSPGAPSSTSTAPAYAVFHVVSAALGLALVFWAGGVFAPWFALIFGLIDLYQALASRMSWFPKDVFLWMPTDDLLHLVLGVFLVILGLTGIVLAGRAAS